MLLLNKTLPCSTEESCTDTPKYSDFLTPAVYRLGTPIVNSWIQIDEETTRSAYELSIIFEKRLEISKIKKQTILTKRLKKPLLIFVDL